MQSILVETDLTPRSEPALRAASRLADQTGAPLHVVHAMGILGIGLWEAIQDPIESRLEAAKDVLVAQLERVLPAGDQPASCAVHFHNTRDAVLLRAREVEAELLVVGAPDVGAPGGVRQTSELEGVLRAATVPLLVVRGPFDLPFTRVALPMSAAEIGQGVLADALEYDEEDPTRSELEVTIDARGIDTAEEQRDVWLRSTAFLGVRARGVIRFRSQRIDPRGTSRFVVIGDLTVRGITCPAVLEVVARGEATGTGGERRMGFGRVLAVSRRQFGVAWHQEEGALRARTFGDEVRVSFDVELVPQEDLPDAA